MSMRCNRCHRPMLGTTAYDGSCECGGLIEATPGEWITLGKVKLWRPWELTRDAFDREWMSTGEIAAGRPVKRHPEWGGGVWWSDGFGVCSPIVAALGGPMGHGS